MMESGEDAEGAEVAGATRPYADVRVIEISIAVAGAYAAMVLGDLGAEVVKIEPPGGDESRRWKPAAAVGDDGCYFLSVNRSKSSIEVDLKSEYGQAVLDRLLESADILIVNFRPRALARLGLDPRAIRLRHPRLIYATVTGFGLDGPQSENPAMDLLIQAHTGLMSITGTEDGTRVKVPIPIVDLAAAMFTLTGIQAALRDRDRSGKGAHIDVSLQDSLIASMLYQVTGYLESGVQPKPMGTAHPGIVPYRTFGTSDGSVVLAVFTDRQFQAACETIGKPELSNDPRYARVDHRVDHRVELEAIFGEALDKDTTEHWLAAMARADVPCSQVRSVAEVADDPHVRAGGAIASLPRPGTGRPMRMPASPIHIDGHRIQPNKPPPQRGGAIRPVLERWGFSVEDLQHIEASATTSWSNGESSSGCRDGSMPDA